MKYDNGTVALWRKFLRWEWYEDVNTKAVFIHLLLTANWKDKKWKGRLIKRGQRWASRGTLARETGLSVQNVRTAIEHLEATGEITTKTTSQGTLITIEKYSDYQVPFNETNQQGSQQSNKPLTSDQPQLNKDNKENNINSRAEPPIPYKEIVDYLNQKTGKGFKHTSKKTQSLIRARWREEYTLDDFKKVIDIKVSEWTGTDFEKYLQPETLFSNKFEGYLNQGLSVTSKADKPTFKEIN